MNIFENVNKKKLVIGLIHLKPLPGTPLYKEGDFEVSMQKAIKDATALYEGGADGCLVQTVDRIYPSGNDTDYARVAAMAIISNEVKRITSPEFHVGVQMMWNCLTPSLAVAKVCGASFTRATAMMGSTESQFGRFDANPEMVQTYRNNINAQDVAMIAEIDGYHFHGMKDIPIAQRAHMAMMVGADAVEVMHADEELNNKLVHDIKTANPNIPVVLGGKTDLENCTRRMKEADAVLVGRCFEGDNWGGNIDKAIVKEYVAQIRAIEK